MLRLLFLLSSIKVIAGETVQVNISFCPINYYGLRYESFYVAFSKEYGILTFNGIYVNETFNSFFDGFLFSKPLLSNMRLETGVELSTHLKEDLAATPFPLESLICAFKMTFFYNDNKNGSFYYADFGKGSVLYAEGFFKSSWLKVFNLFANGSIIDQGDLKYSETKPTRALVDLTGCRYSGKVMKVKTTQKVPNKCSTWTCEHNFSVSVENLCPPPSQCFANDICLTTASCSVIGQNVLDNNGRVNTISDRCVYTLLSMKGLEVLAEFKDRRRTDLSFLDSLYLNLDQRSFHLGQGAHVYLNGTSLNLNCSVQVFNGVELSKNPEGVHVKVTFPSFILTVFFDGSTALISTLGNSVPEGLCFDSTGPIKDQRRIDVSEPSCRKSFPEAPDCSINCTAVSEECNNLLGGASNSSDTDTKPFVEACINTMCIYPDDDGFFCHFVDLFRRSSDFENIDPLQESLPSPCVHHYCSPHEFCGVTDSAEAQCYCRAVFAAPYRETSTYGDSTLCGVDTAAVELPTCLMEEKGYNVSQMHLLDANCKGHIDESKHTVTFTFSHSQPCSAIVSTSGNQIIYENRVLDSDPASDSIIRSKSVNLHFYCTYEQPQANVMSFKVEDTSVMQRFTSGYFNYTVKQRACMDPTCKKQFSAGDVLRLDQTMWVVLDADGLDQDQVVLVMDSCWVSDQSSGDGGQRHNVIVNGCANPEDGTVKVGENGDGDRCSFSFKLFQFIGSSEDVHLLCKLAVCLRDSECVPKCSSGKKRRSVSQLWTSSFSSLSWSSQVSSSSSEAN